MIAMLRRKLRLKSNVKDRQTNPYEFFTPVFKTSHQAFIASRDWQKKHYTYLILHFYLQTRYCSVYSCALNPPSCCIPHQSNPLLILYEVFIYRTCNPSFFANPLRVVFPICLMLFPCICVIYWKRTYLSNPEMQAGARDSHSFKIYGSKSSYN